MLAGDAVRVTFGATPEHENGDDALTLLLQPPLFPADTPHEYDAPGTTLADTDGSLTDGLWHQYASFVQPIGHAPLMIETNAE